MKTNDNLGSSISSSAISSVKYYAYSLIAEKEGYRQVARLFKALAKAETVQAINGLQLAGDLDGQSTYDLVNMVEPAVFVTELHPLVEFGRVEFDRRQILTEMFPYEPV